jgi:hypothetical protein
MPAEPVPGDGSRLVVRVWLPDRPGALGLVASRIGALGADIVGIDVLERSASVAVDEFAVVLPRTDLVPLLVREIGEVDGASVEEWQLVERFPDPRLDALETIEQIVQAGAPADLALRLAAGVRVEFGADWSAVIRDSEVLAEIGAGVPQASVLHALATGTTASPAVAAGEAGPDDLAIAPIEDLDALLLVGRSGHPFRRRERQQLLAIARIADRLASLVK